MSRLNEPEANQPPLENPDGSTPESKQTERTQINASGERSVAAQTINGSVYTGDHHYYIEGGRPIPVVSREEFTRKYIESFKQRVSRDQYQLDERFVNLTLMIDKGEKQTQQWERQSLKSIAEIQRFRLEFS